MTAIIDTSRAMEFFEEALAYQHSAQKLHELLPPKPYIGLPLSDPVYFLYYHAAELALKACLLSRGVSVEETHGIRKLFDACWQDQLLDKNKHSELCTLVIFLGGLRTNAKEVEVEDYGVGYRYASRNGLVPTLEWVREDVESLITEIRPRLEKWTEAIGGTDQVTRFRYGISKPPKLPE